MLSHAALLRFSLVVLASPAMATGTGQVTRFDGKEKPELPLTNEIQASALKAPRPVTQNDDTVVVVSESICLKLKKRERLTKEEFAEVRHLAPEILDRICKM